MGKSIFISIAIVIIFFLSFCTSEKENIDGNNEATQSIQKSRSKRENLNISILIDLSDRINPKKNLELGVKIVDRDLGYIKSISEAFESHLKGGKIITTNDNIQVFFEPEPMNSEINSLANKLKLSFTKHNISTTSVKQIVPTFVNTSSRIYDLALKDKHFIGSDIWTFFKNNVDTYCILPNHRNVLIILTDGYMLHIDNQKRVNNQTTYLSTKFIKQAGLNNPKFKEIIEQKQFGFIPATTNLENLEVLVLGIKAEKGKDFEEDVIKKYWGDWFRAMGIKKYHIKNADLASNLDPVIKQILLPKSK